MLSKEVKDILEGIHFFLTDGLKKESLSGKVECMRRGLLLQLEELRTTYPFLHFSSDVETNANICQTSPPTIPSYLNVTEHQNANSYRMSTSSSGSTNYSSTGGSNSSSTGYSGDGVVTTHNQSNAVMATRPESYEEFEEFEEFETCSNMTTTTAVGLTPPPPRRQSLEYFRKEPAEDRDEDSYAEDVEAVPFRIIVGKCDFHGMLSKRSRGLLPGMRNSKAFLCVLAGPLLYLYQKEGDDKQKKVIELSGYHVQEAPIDEQKVNSKRRDFAFQLVGPGKKTHVFFTSKKALMDRWMTFLKRTIAEGSGPALNGESPLSKAALTKLDEDSLWGENSDFGDDNEEDVYEELGPEEGPPENFSSPPALPMCNYRANSSQTASEETSEYYSVPEEAEESLFPQPSSSTEQKQSRLPSERAFLPTLVRPLPDAPPKQLNTLEDDDSVYDDIYCEIDEPELPQSSPGDYFNNSISLSKDIFDAIKERVPAKSQDEWEGPDSDGYDEPTDDVNLSAHTSPLLPKTPSLPPTIPNLPPKSTGTNEPESEEESNYKVPSSMVVNTEQLYQIPQTNPIRVPWADDLQSRVFKHASIEIQKVAEKDLSDTPIDEDEGRMEQITDSSDQDDHLEQRGKPHSINSTQVNPSAVLSEPKTHDPPPRKISSSSVKDLIAKMNKTDQFAETSHSPTHTNASFKKHKLSVTASFDKSSVVENKIKLGILRNVTQVKIDSENKEKQSRTLREIKTGDSKFQANKFNRPTTPEAPSIDRNSKEVVYENCDGENGNYESTQDLEWPAMYIAKFAFVSNKRGDLSFNRGDEILIKKNPGDAKMWRGVLREQEGFVLRNYLRKKDPS